MSTAVKPDLPTPTPASATSPSSAPTGGTGSSAPSQPTAATEWRAGANAPTWAQGKTSEEILGIATQLASVVEQQVRQPTPPAPAQPTAPRNPDGTFAPVADDDFLTGAAFNRAAPQYMNRYYQETIQPQLNAIAEIGAQNALETVKREFASEFQKYGPSINATLASVTDKRAWTVDNLRKLVKYSLADHVDEIARDKAARLVAEMPETLRSNGAALPAVAPHNPTSTLQSEKIPADWKERAASVGLNERAVDEFCVAQGLSREEFFKQFDTPQIITEIAQKKPGQGSTPI